MKTVYWYLVLQKLDHEGNPHEERIDRIVSSRIRYSTPQTRYELLAKPACKLWGQEGRDWRIVQLSCLFGCFAQRNDKMEALFIK